MKPGQVKRRTRSLGLLMLLLMLTVGSSAIPAMAGPSQAPQSTNVVIIGGSTLDLTRPCVGTGPQANNMGWTAGGCLTVTGPPTELGAFTFTPMMPAAVSAASLAPFDTAVLNVASTAMACNTATLTASQKADIIAFVNGGKKLIIFDSECSPQDYSWLPYPFTTANPGALGAPGTLTIVEENTLSSNNPASPKFIDAVDLSTHTDAVGDMNVMTTLHPAWCEDMTGTNAIGKTGPVHVYARLGPPGSVGLIIYNGLDQNYQGFGLGNANLVKIWVQELQQPFNPDGLPCGTPVVVTSVGGITQYTKSGTGSSGFPYVAMIGGLASVALVAGSWFARRRWQR